MPEYYYTYRYIIFSDGVNILMDIFRLSDGKLQEDCIC